MMSIGTNDRHVGDETETRPEGIYRNPDGSATIVQQDGSSFDVAKVDKNAESVNLAPVFTRARFIGNRLNRALEHLAVIETLFDDHQEELSEILDLEEIDGAAQDIRNAIEAAEGDLAVIDSLHDNLHQSGVAELMAEYAAYDARKAWKWNGGSPADGIETSWRDHFPEGRTIFYQGDNPEGFRQQIKTEFGFDVAAPEHRGYVCRPDIVVQHTEDTWNEAHGWQFHCPPEHLDAIYGSRRFPMGT